MSEYNFIAESNLIEGICRPPSAQEIKEHKRFLQLPDVTIDELVKFVNVYQPNAVIRDKAHLNVRVGDHVPPRGGMNIVYDLQALLSAIMDKTPYKFHVEYETLHPFTDCNGRAGRALWAWQMLNLQNINPDKFYHYFYYQSLNAARIIAYEPTEFDISYDIWMEEIRFLASKLDDNILDLPSPWTDSTIRQAVLNRDFWIDRYDDELSAKEVLDSAIHYSLNIKEEDKL